MCAMKATMQIPDEMYREVKAKSALQGRSVRSVTIMLYASWLRGLVDESGMKSSVVETRPAAGSKPLAQSRILRASVLGGDSCARMPMVRMTWRP